MPSISLSTLMNILFVVVAVLFVLAIVMINFAVKIVPENKRLVVFRMGKCLGGRGPGIVTVIPVIDYAVWVDLQRAHHFTYRDLFTSDNEKISYTVTLDGKVVDAEKSIMNVPNLENALSGVVETELKDITRSKNSSELIRLDHWMEDQLKDVIHRSGKSWGYEVVNVTVQRNSF